MELVSCSRSPIPHSSTWLKPAVNFCCVTNVPLRQKQNKKVSFALQLAVMTEPLNLERWENMMRAQVRLEFYQRRKRQWPMPEDHIPWEVWNLQLDVVRTDKLGKS